MKSNTDDYLKYWRIVRYYMKMKHGLTQTEIEVLLFLYSEKYFDKKKFYEFNTLLPWDKDRFEKLKKNGWIEVFRRRVGTWPTRYQLTRKSINMVRDIYKKLRGEEIPTSLASNKIFLKNASYTDKRYKEMIIEMNKAIRQQRHQTHE